MSNAHIYVSEIRKTDVLVQGLSSTLPAWLAKYRVKDAGNGEHRISVAGPEQIALLRTLRDHGVAFAGGQHGWPPAEILAELRDRGLLQGEFEEITFARPGSPIIRKR